MIHETACGTARTRGRRPQVFEIAREVAMELNSGCMVHPTVKVAFDGSDGIEAFKESHLNNPKEDFWTEFGQILSLGGRFRTPDSFDAPYTFSDWPDDFDAFE